MEEKLTYKQLIKLYISSKQKLKNVNSDTEIRLIYLPAMDVLKEVKELEELKEMKEEDKKFIKFLLENNRSFYVNPRVLRYYMIKKNLTNEDIGKMLNKSVWAINRYFAQDRKILLPDLFKLAKLLDIPFYYIIDIKKYKEAIL